MTTDDLEQLLEGQSETQRIEFKRSCPWGVITFAKDILALSNVRDGGYIIIGVEDENCQRIGVTVEDAETYKIDDMKDQMAPFADPHVLFEKVAITDKNGLDFIVIKVDQFREIPTICKRNDQNAGIHEGNLYYRNSNRRAESAVVSNSYDMRDIVEMAAIKMMQKKKEIGYEVEDSDQSKLDQELEGL
ncbi:MAG: ATP-binding protein [Patescibacteria group bacterium]